MEKVAVRSRALLTSFEEASPSLCISLPKGPFTRFGILVISRFFWGGLTLRHSRMSLRSYTPSQRAARQVTAAILRFYSEAAHSRCSCLVMSCEGGLMQASGGLAMEQLSPLRHRS